MDNTTPTPPPANSASPAGPSPDPGIPPTPAGGPSGSANDINPHKAIAIIGYIIPLLFFIPLLTDGKYNAYAKFHANQQLNLLLFWVAINILAMIPILGWILYPFTVIAGFILMIIGIINASKDQQKPLPLIGSIQLLH